MSNYIDGIKIAYSGLGVTLQITLVAVLLGVSIGLIVAICKMSKNLVLRAIANVYIEILRGTPLLVQALIIYNGVPMILQSNGIMFKWEYPVVAGMIACGINSSAYVAEIIRSGLQAIDKGQMEAARSLGMGHFQSMRFIIIPQAFRIILPALGNEFITLIKESAVLSVISIVEITRKSMLWSSATFLAWPAYLGTAFVYLTLTIPLSRGVSFLERRMAQSDRSK
ncbi:amino acid ABC transporter permease [Clostridium aminobutyricum]|uniref:Amino acid ABC transporter permease n=1 Tax=Clostridium aminobutyricum TaxID=33953 RepID=A0A939D714_CLOAM|nr:amino acid ABC transporter permease [Clostridium aminobutyricum]MBN7771918.1 amino acid ABC transporter permease [Clostridium aminobutyricum]